MCNRTTREVSAENKDLREKIILDTVVKRLLESGHRLRVIEPYIGEKKEVQVGKLVAYTDRKLGLGYNESRKGG